VRGEEIKERELVAIFFQACGKCSKFEVPIGTDRQPDRPTPSTVAGSHDEARRDSTRAKVERAWLVALQPLLNVLFRGWIRGGATERCKCGCIRKPLD
jgi:hypothetical protein